MTTIAYRNGIMAADTLVVGGDIRRGDVQKLRETSLGSIVGVSGQAGMTDDVVKWLDGGALREDFPKPPPDRHISGIVAFLDGRVAVFSTDGILQFVDAEFVATGSGNEIALGAMAMGATAAEAVGIAAQFDVYTGGRIVTLAANRSSASPLTRTE